MLLLWAGGLQTYTRATVAAWDAATVATAAASSPTAITTASAAAPSLRLRHSVPSWSFYPEHLEYLEYRTGSPHHACCAPPHCPQLRQVSSTHLPALGSALSLSMNSQSQVSA